MWNLFFFFFHFLWKDGLGYEAQAGSVCSGNIDFPEQYISERGGKTKKTKFDCNSKAGGLRSWQKTIKSEEQNNKNPGRLIICKVEHTGVGISNLNRRHGSIYRPRI